MHGTNSTNTDRSKNGDGKSAAVVGAPGDKSDGDDWFAQFVRTVYAGKAGTALHFATGFPERDCQRYAAGQVRPPGYFVRAYLRSDEGWQFLAYLMDGSGAKWWAEVVRAKRIAEAVDREI